MQWVGGRSHETLMQQLLSRILGVGGRHTCSRNSGGSRHEISFGP